MERTGKVFTEKVSDGQINIWRINKSYLDKEMEWRQKKFEAPILKKDGVDWPHTLHLKYFSQLLLPHFSFKEEHLALIKDYKKFWKWKER